MWRKLLIIIAVLGLAGCCTLNPQAPACNPWTGYRFDKNWKAHKL
jgi:hypothetical protein